jgi:4-amino-4-deoxy-L-arabinose transferase-like glycosyltransferase
LKVFRSPAALLVVLCAALVLPGLVMLPPVDRDEPRYAQATRQMLESGDYVVPRFQDEGRFKKPIGIYWLQAAAVTLVGRRDAIAAYRLPSFVGAVAAVLATYFLGLRLFDARTAFYAGLLLATSSLFLVEATLATTDAALLAAVVIAQACLARLFVARENGTAAERRDALGFWAAEAVATLLKGPVGPAVAALTIAALVWRSPRRANWPRDLHLAQGIVLFAAIVAPWALLVGERTAWQFYRHAFRGDLLPKVLGGHESHGAPPGTYFALSFITFWPASLALPSGWIAAVRDRRDPSVAFCLAWIVPTWLFFELLPTKLPHYVLPTYPAVALLMARAIPVPPAKLAVAAWMSVALVFLLGCLALPPILGARVGPFSMLPSVVIVATTVAVASLWRGERSWRPAPLGAVGAGIAFAVCFGGLLPRLSMLWPSRSIGDAVTAARETIWRPVAAVGYGEPSLVFVLGDVHLVDPAGAARFITENQHAIVCVRDDLRAAVESASDVPLRPLAIVNGWNLSKGKRVRIVLLERAEAIATTERQPRVWTETPALL